MRTHVHMAVLMAMLGIVLQPVSVSGGGGPKNALLVINQNSSASRSIGAYYQQKRGIPERNICRITCSTDELVSKAECETNIVAPIREYINSSGLHDRLDYIVITKGVPLKASYDDAAWWGPLSVASVLTCVGEPSIVSYLTNPCGPLSSPGLTQSFSHQLIFSGRSYYVVTRLDAYTVEQVYRMIDDALDAAPSQGLFILDGAAVSGSAYVYANRRLWTANQALMSMGCTTAFTDETMFNSHQLVGNQQGVIGYFGWGSHDPAYSLAAYVSNHFLPGSIGDTYVSTSGRTFTYPPEYGQSLIADLIPQGLSAGTGYVSEPKVDYATRPDALFPRYTQGYNMGESFFAATPRLYWKSVTVGDPLMAPYATPPMVAISSPAAGSTVRGSVLVQASATDASGIGKVEFYVDDILKATCAQPPYQFAWDTSTTADGPHLLEVIAYENSPVFTQGMASASVEVRNVAQDVLSIAGLDSLPAGTLVRLASKPVVAGADAFTDCIYLSEADRTAGVRVEGDFLDVATGSTVTVTGDLTFRDGERVIADASVDVTGTASSPLSPLGMANLTVANKGANSDAEFADLWPGLSCAGLLIRTWGWVTDVSPGSFTVGDGSLSWAGTGVYGVKVLLNNTAVPLSSPPLNTYVLVTGVCCFSKEGERLAPAVRPRFAADLVVGPRNTILPVPDTAVRPGWNLLSFPGVLLYPRADRVLVGMALDGKLLHWDSVRSGLFSFSEFQPEDFPTISPGLGLWFDCADVSRVSVAAILDEPSVDMWISLPRAGYSLIGCPFGRTVDLLQCQVSDGASLLPMDQAAAMEWVDPCVYTYDNIAKGLDALAVTGESTVSMQPWKAYWMKSYRPNLALIVPHPLNQD